MGAAGSIIGTFAAGYYLIAAMGTISIIWAIGGAMILMSLLYTAKFRISRVCAIFFLCALLMGVSRWEWTQKTGVKLGLRKQNDPAVIYEDETQYCYVSIKTVEGPPEQKLFVQDQLIHSAITDNNVSTLEYSYEQIMAAVTHRFSKGKNKPSFLILGGGGYVLPRYLEKFWPGSVVDVVEIDPGVTEAAHKAFNLERATTINTISLDARNYIDELTEQLQSGKKTKKYDFIYEDALDHYAIPYQLTTLEFNKKISQILNDDGIYMVELIDIFDSGLFLGAFVNTIRQAFPFVSIISEYDVGTGDRNTFVVIAAKHKLNLQNVCEGRCQSKKIWYLNDSDMAKAREKAKRRILTDDYAPVENLITPVVRECATEAAVMYKKRKAREFAKEAENLAWSGNLDKTLAKLEQLVAADPAVSVRAYQTMALIFADSGRAKEALEIYKTAINRYDKNEFKNEMTELRYNFGMLLNKSGRTNEAREQFGIASAGYRNILAENSASINPYMQLGNMAAEIGDFTEAAKYFQEAVRLKPGDLDNNFNLIMALEAQGNFDAAIAAAKNAAGYMLDNNQTENAAKIKDYTQKLELKKSQSDNIKK